MTIAVDWDIKPQTKLDLCQKTNITKAVFSEENYDPKWQIESESMLTALYCVKMIQAEIQEIQEMLAKAQFWSNFTKCCGYLE